MFNILSWNIQQGGGSRVNSIIKYILTKKPQLVVLNEFKNNANGISIRTKLLQNGYLHQVVSKATSDLNSVLIASKVAGSSFLFSKNELQFPQSMLKLSLEVFDVYGVYFPHKKKHNCFEVLLDDLQKTDRPAIITGDYNSGKNFIDQKGDSFWYENYFFKMEELGYIDAFRLIHGDKKEYSWFSHLGNGYRYDHMYISAALQALVKDCFYDQQAREDKLSDHTPMFLVLS